MLGGGMRQAGIIAAAGLVALDRMVDRLAEDHANARRLAEGLATMPGIELDLDRVQTNIVIFRTGGPRSATGSPGRSERGGSGGHVEAPSLMNEIVQGCLARKVKVHAMGPGAIRCVTHKDVDADDIARALEAIHEITQGWGR
jgi:threonine aldolase